jgi:hypothetical protein
MALWNHLLFSFSIRRAGHGDFAAYYQRDEHNAFAFYSFVIVGYGSGPGSQTRVYYGFWGTCAGEGAFRMGWDGCFFRYAEWPWNNLEIRTT